MEHPTGADGEDASDDFFRSQITGLAAGVSISDLQITSDDDPTDSYTQRLVPDDGSLVQPDFAVLYNGDMELATDDAPMTTAEDSEILDGLQLDAVHNQSATSTITIGNQKFTRTMQAPPASQFSFTSDVVDAGGQIAGNLALPADYLGWTVTVSTSDNQTSVPLLDTANDVSFDFPASAAGYVTITATATPMGFGIRSVSLANSAVVDVLQSGTLSTYAQQAWSALHVNGVVQGDPIARNRLISTLYAKMFDLGPPVPFAASGPNPYEWFGIASFVSANAGSAMSYAQSMGWITSIPGAGAAGVPNAQNLLYYLGLGNLSVFEDMYAQGLAYEGGGIKAVLGVLADPQRKLQRDGWNSINAAILNANQSDITTGVEDLAEYEQEFTLQAVVNQDPKDFNEASSLPNWIYPLVSGVPRDTLSFQQWCTSTAGKHSVGSIYSFENGVNRYDYFLGDILLAWQGWRGNHTYINPQTLLQGGYKNT